MIGSQATRVLLFRSQFLGILNVASVTLPQPARLFVCNKRQGI